MKKVLLIAFCVIFGANCFSQGGNNKFFVGVSMSSSQDDLRNNSLLSGYMESDKCYTRGFELSGELGYHFDSDGSVGADIGYYSNSTIREDDVSANDHYNGTIKGFMIAPKYRVSKSFLGKIELYTDFKIQLHYLIHENVISILYETGNEDEYLNGTEFRYGFSVDPGLMLNLGKTFSVKLDYPIANVFHSTVKESGDSDIDFETINSWEYDFSMNLSRLRLGVVFRF